MKLFQWFSACIVSGEGQKHFTDVKVPRNRCFAEIASLWSTNFVVCPHWIHFQFGSVKVVGSKEIICRHLALSKWVSVKVHFKVVQSQLKGKNQPTQNWGSHSGVVLYFMTPCILVDDHQLCGVTCCRHLQFLSVTQDTFCAMELRYYTFPSSRPAEHLLILCVRTVSVPVWSLALDTQ